MSRRLAAILVALVMALVGTTAVFTYVSSAEERAVEGQQAVEVLVAAKSIPVGTKAQQALDDELVRTEVLPRKAVPAGALSEIPAAMRSFVATSAIGPGEVVLASRFGKTSVATGGLDIPKGKLAVAVELADPARVGGYVTVGSQVAIFDTFNVLKGGVPTGDRLAEGRDNNRVTRVLLPRVPVLAVGPAKAGDDEESSDTAGQNAATTVLTVAVTQQEAEKLVHAIQTGTLYLGLLTADSTVTRTPGVDNPSLFR